MSDLLRIEKEGVVAVMYWQHAPQNQFNDVFLQEIVDALKEIEADRSIKALVITSGVEKFFSTGLALEWLMQTAATNPPAILDYFILLNEFMVTVTGFAKPVIGAITGHCVAMGAIIGACMDYRFMTNERGFVRTPEMEINIPFLPGMNAILKEIMPPASWRDFAYTADKFTGEQAMAMGYIDKLCPPDELLPTAIEFANKLGGFKMSTYAAIKRENRRLSLDIMKKEDPDAIRNFVAKFTGG